MRINLEIIIAPIFSQSFESGKVPDIWKTAVVTPIFRSRLPTEGWYPGPIVSDVHGLSDVRPMSDVCWSRR